MNLSAWRNAGPFREDFFIDEVDHEYSLRLRRHGWLVKITREVMMSHAVGSGRMHRLPWRRLLLSHHSALRRYYMGRNRVLLARAHLRFDPKFVCGQLFSSVYECGLVLLFETDKLAKLRAIATGTFDGLRGRSGRAVRHIL